MLWNASALHGCPIQANDGQGGTVTNLMYEDVNRDIRWVVVDTGDWLSGRRVLLPVSALGQPDPEAHHLPANLTTMQVQESPDFDASQPLSPMLDGLVREYLVGPTAATNPYGAATTANRLAASRPRRRSL